MPDFSYFITSAGELLRVADGIHEQWSGQFEWMEYYHSFWLALYLDFLARFGGG